MSFPPPPTVLENALVVEPSGTRAVRLRLASGRVARDDDPPRRDDLVVSLEGHLVLPGLVNAHEHLGLNAFPPADAGRPRANAYDWIDALQPLLATEGFRAVKGVDERVRAWHGALKNLLSGATTVAHHDPWLPVMEDPAFPVRVVHPYGWCHSPRLAGRYGPSMAEGLAATPAGAPFLIHLAEGTDEEAEGELSLLDRLGGLGPATVLAHAVGLGIAGVERVLAAGAGVAWCPASNLRVLGTTLDPRELMAAGRLALGTDSRLSGSPDLLGEMGVARDRAGIDARDLLRLVTSDAARVFGRRDAGHLGPGAVADLVVVRESGGDPRGTLAGLPRASLRAVVLGGAPRVADADLLPWLVAAGVPARQVHLDGVPKVVDARLFTDEASALEPGLAPGTKAGARVS